MFLYIIFFYTPFSFTILIILIINGFLLILKSVISANYINCLPTWTFTGLMPSLITLETLL